MQLETLLHQPVTRLPLLPASWHMGLRLHDHLQRNEVKDINSEDTQHRQHVLHIIVCAVVRCT
jgi:hypothetical protein